MSFVFGLLSAIQACSISYIPIYPFFYTDPYPFRHPSIHLWRTRGNSKSQILCLSLYREWFHAGAFRYNMLYLSNLIIRPGLLNISSFSQKASLRVIDEAFAKIWNPVFAYLSIWRAKNKILFFPKERSTERLLCQFLIKS